jgi:hypothetical protein|tara:strand:+ start:322 stop:573 length:252 start_codon:yes stop_codon:yes gene_type:complete
MSDWYYDDDEDDDTLVLPENTTVEELVDTVEMHILKTIELANKYDKLAETFPNAKKLEKTLKAMTMLRGIAVQLDGKYRHTYH